MDSEKIVSIGLVLIIFMVIIFISIVNDYVYTKFPDTNVVPTPAVDNGKEVYHLSNNVYSYNEAQNACSKYGAQLATKKQLDNAYNNGANWCSYGWSADKTAYFPIQKSFHDNLSDKNKNKCGRVGINGGYFNDTDLNFGANCYGKRPTYDELADGDMIASFYDTWAPNGDSKMETFVCNGKRIPILNLDDGYDKLHKFE